MQSEAQVDAVVTTKKTSQRRLRKVEKQGQEFRKLSRLPQGVFCSDYRGREACFKALRDQTKKPAGLVYVVMGTGAENASVVIWNHRGLRLLGQWSLKSSTAKGVLFEVLPAYTRNWKLAWISYNKEKVVSGYSVATAGGIKRYYPLSSEQTGEVVSDSWIGLKPDRAPGFWDVERVLRPFRRSFPRPLTPA